ncbi:shikimate kinase [Lactiplantibacillus daowaiensis]|uniref:Shikimate kinase n=1 Tax=Lactiplantibacillus daowaiensis TaxID=2559918 RepID=A0ABW1RWV7_9LACO|nr:shikimate kinase [Lactiplantibacillus daowaiensis]
MKAILIGFMGSGKTTVGRLLAQQTGTEHADLDELIVASAGCAITDIFANQGEAYFRRLEQQTLRRALTTPGILSTGGGTPTMPANAAILTASPVPVILLAASDATILQRVTGDASRPLVNDLDTTALLDLKHRRAPLYEAAADLVIQTDALTPQQIVTTIQDWLAQPAQQVARA